MKKSERGNKTKNFQDVLHWVPKLNNEFFALRDKLDAHDPRVTQGVRTRLADIEAKWAGAEAVMQGILEVDLAAFNRMFRESNLPAVQAE